MNDNHQKKLSKALRKNLLRRKRINNSTCKTKIMIIISLLLINISQASIVNQGYRLDKNKIETIKKKNMTRKDTIKKIGTPTIIDNNLTYIYLYRIYKRASYHTYKIKKQENIIIYFNVDSNIKKIDIYRSINLDRLRLINVKTKFIKKKTDVLEEINKNIKSLEIYNF